ARQCAATCSASASVIRPSRAHARARAASTSSSACSQARSETSAVTPPRAYVPPNSSDVEEDGLAGALEADVESVAIVGAAGEQRRAPLVGDAVRHRTFRDADAGAEVPQQAAGEDVDLEVRRVGDDDRPAALVVGRAAGERAGVLVPGLD